jgi:hypothetical protein
MKPFQASDQSARPRPAPAAHAFVGATSVAMASCSFLLIKCRAFTLLRRASYFSFTCPKEKSPRENDTPLTRFAGIVPAKSAGGLRGLSTGLPALTPNWFASLRTTLRAVPPPTRRFRGAPGRATRLLRVLFRRARATLRFGFSPSAGHDGPLLSRGPCAAVRRGRQAAQRASTWLSMPFRQGRMPCRKARPRLTDLPPTDGRQAPSGVAFSFGYFSLGHTREK